MLQRFVPVTVLAALAALGGCGGGSSATEPPPAPPIGATVTAQGTSFAPGEVTVHVNHAVKWNMMDGPHTVHFTVNAPPGNNPNSGDVAAGSSVSTTFVKLGNVSYICDRHAAQGMQGTINVVP